MSRLYVHLFAFAAVLFLPFIVRAWIVGDERKSRPTLGAAALELTIITPHNQDIRRAFELAFSDWHERSHGKPVAITYLSPGGTNDIVRYLKDVYGGYGDERGNLLPEQQVHAGIDLVWGGGDYTFEREFKPMLKPLSLPLERIAEAFPERDLAGVSLIDPDAGQGKAPRWVGVVLSSFGIIYAPDVYAALRLPAPETWSDLARPELRGLLALADPTRSGSAAFTYLMVLQRAMAAAERRWLDENPGAPAGEALEALEGYREALAEGWKEGMRVLVLMAANARYFTDSGSRPCADVGDAESAAGIAIDFYARVYEDEIGHDRLRFHAPRGATAITPDPIGILYGTRGERELLANRFVEFLLSREGQRLWNLRGGKSPYLSRSLRRLPIRRDVYADRTDFADDENPFELAQGFNTRQRWTRQLGRLLPIWGAAWMDAKSVLDDAYEAVLELPDPGLRARLLFELSDIPVEYAEVSASRPRDAAPGADPRLLAARERLSLGRRFRDHYAGVLARARETR